MTMTLTLSFFTKRKILDLPVWVGSNRPCVLHVCWCEYVTHHPFRSVLQWPGRLCDSCLSRLVPLLLIYPLRRGKLELPPKKKKNKKEKLKVCDIFLIFLVCLTLRPWIINYVFLATVNLTEESSSIWDTSRLKFFNINLEFLWVKASNYLNFRPENWRFWYVSFVGPSLRHYSLAVGSRF